MRLSRLLALANEGIRFALVPLDNELTIGEDGWARIAPYGDSVKERTIKDPASGKIIRQRFVQRLSLANAKEMADKANSLWGKIKRFRVGIPIFRGHPDLGTHSPLVVGADRQARPEELGVLAELSARDDGLYAKPLLHSAGRLAVENDGLKWFSPFWWVRMVGEENGQTIVEPHELISAGLTDRPNIQGGDALANANQKKDNTMNREKLILLLALANDATDEQIEEAIKLTTGKLKTTAEALANEQAEHAKAKARVVELNTRGESFAADVRRVSAERDAKADALANERARADKLTLDAAVADGRLTGATRPEWETALANAETHDAKLAELAALKPVIKTGGAATAGLGARKGVSTIDQRAGIREQIISLANERVNNFKGDWQRAYNDVERTHPALFEAMQKPAAS